MDNNGKGGADLHKNPKIQKRKLEKDLLGKANFPD